MSGPGYARIEAPCVPHVSVSAPQSVRVRQSRRIYLKKGRLRWGFASWENATVRLRGMMSVLGAHGQSVDQNKTTNKKKIDSAPDAPFGCALGGARRARGAGMAPGAAEGALLPGDCHLLAVGRGVPVGGGAGALPGRTIHPRPVPRHRPLGRPGMGCGVMRTSWDGELEQHRGQRYGPRGTKLGSKGKHSGGVRLTHRGGPRRPWVALPGAS